MDPAPIAPPVLSLVPLVAAAELLPCHIPAQSLIGLIYIYTTTDLAFCPGSKLAFVPVLEPGQKPLEAFVPGGRTGTKGA